MKKILALISIAFVVLCSFQTMLGINVYSLFSHPRWEIESMNVGDYEINIPNEMQYAFLEFKQSDVLNSIFGIVGCNDIKGSISIKGEGQYIILRAQKSSNRVCNSELESRIEELFLRNVNGGFVVKGNEERIDLIGEKMRVRLVPSLLFEP